MKTEKDLNSILSSTKQSLGGTNRRKSSNATPNDEKANADIRQMIEV